MDDEIIDEDHMKEIEKDLTSEAKEQRKIKAESLKEEGNEFFKSGEFSEAAGLYTRALCICPLAYNKLRAVLYSNRAVCKIKMDLKESAIEDCSNAIEKDPHYLKALLRRAQLYQETEKLDEALADYTKILELDPRHVEANIACRRLPDEIKERNEKMKTEMLGKLKDLGNLLLKPFGLSTDNFQMQKNNESGGYSVNFKSGKS